MLGLHITWGIESKLTWSKEEVSKSNSLDQTTLTGIKEPTLTGSTLKMGFSHMEGIEAVWITWYHMEGGAPMGEEDVWKVC